jgi:hypothetical protein
MVFLSMRDTYILYNATSPICRQEITNYMKRAQTHDLPMVFQDLNTTDLSKWNLTRDQAMKNLHVMQGDKIFTAIPAFMILWEMMPGYRRWARLAKMPGMRQLVGAFYDHLLMPYIYKQNKTRDANAFHEKRVPKSS